MKRVYSANEFLLFLNGRVEVISPERVKLVHNAEAKSANLFPECKLALALNVDLIISGPCSSYLEGSLPPVMFDQHFPMGKSLTRRGEPEKSWLHELIKNSNPQPKNILVYPSCCGVYGTDYKDLLKSTIPDINWIFPDVGDLCEDEYNRVDDLVHDLLRAKILKVDEATT